MYLLDNLHHNTPHFHAKYAEFEASLLAELHLIDSAETEAIASS